MANRQRQLAPCDWAFTFAHGRGYPRASPSHPATRAAHALGAGKGKHIEVSRAVEKATARAQRVRSPAGWAVRRRPTEARSEGTPPPPPAPRAHL